MATGHSKSGPKPSDRSRLANVHARLSMSATGQSEAIEHVSVGSLPRKRPLRPLCVRGVGLFCRQNSTRGCFLKNENPHRHSRHSLDRWPSRATLGRGRHRVTDHKSCTMRGPTQPTSVLLTITLTKRSDPPLSGGIDDLSQESEQGMRCGTKVPMPQLPPQL
jgi:hypothetical protein